MSAQPEASAQHGGYRIGWIWELQEAGSVALRGTKASPEWSLDGIRGVGGNSYQGAGESGTAVLASEPTSLGLKAQEDGNQDPAGWLLLQLWGPESPLLSQRGSLEALSLVGLLRRHPPSPPLPSSTWLGWLWSADGTEPFLEEMGRGGPALWLSHVAGEGQTGRDRRLTVKPWSPVFRERTI